MPQYFGSPAMMLSFNNIGKILLRAYVPVDRARGDDNSAIFVISESLGMSGL